MAELLRMPEVAANTTEAVLASWAVRPGSAFVAGAALAIVETAKAAVDLEAETDGVLVRTLVAEGHEVAVGAPIALLAAPGERVDDVDAELAKLSPDRVAQAVPTPPDEPAGHHRLFISPLARRLARDAGIAADQLTGTGPNNRIVRRDVETAIAHRQPAGSTPPVEPRAPHHDVPHHDLPHHDLPHHDVPHSRLRRAIAASLTASKQHIPHFYVRATARVEELLHLREQLNDAAGTRVSVTDLVVKAVAAAHVLEPAMNVIWTDDAVRVFDSVDVAIAVATDDGIRTPVIRGADAQPVGELARRSADLVARARARRLRQDELEGGTTTVTNLGMFDTDEFAAIINPPQSSIVAVGAIRTVPVARNGHIEVAAVMTLTVSVDHRPVDGVVAARWLRHLVQLLENPVRLLR